VLRQTAVDAHPQKDEIEQRLAKGDSITSLSNTYGISRHAITNHKKTRLPNKLIKGVRDRDITSADELFQIILGTVRKMEKVSESCDNYLQDPNNPDLYYMGPRAHEVDVMWEEEIDIGHGNTIFKKHKDTLQELIDKHLKGCDIVKMKSTHADPRVLLIKSAETLTKQMDMLVQAWRSVDQGSSAFIGTPAFQNVVKTILDATKEYPEVRRTIANGLSNLTE